MIDVDRIVEIFGEKFELPTELKDLLVAGGLTEKQATALVMDSEGSSITQIAQTLAGSKNTQNAYYALKSGYEKLANSFIIASAVKQDQDLLRSFLTEVFKKQKLDLGVERVEIA